MNRSVFLSLVLLMTVGGSAAAQMLPETWSDDNIGLYLDPNDWTSLCMGHVPPGLVEIHVVGRALTSDTVKGIELLIRHEGPATMGTVRIPSGVDFGTREGEHIIAYTDPLPVVGGQFVFASYDLLVTADNQVTHGFIGPIFEHSLPEAVPAYLDGEDLELIKPLTNVLVWEDFPEVEVPVLHLNPVDLLLGCWTIPAEPTSWGGVKALFR